MELQAGRPENAVLQAEAPPAFPTAGVSPPSVSIEFRNLSYEIKTRVGWRDTRRQVLHDVSGSARPKSVLAIMGPTGSGKTTLLNALALRLRAGEGTLKGSIFVNGQPHAHLLPCLSAYVLQEDRFLAEMTVREVLTTAALLRLPESVPKAEKKRAVEGLLSDLGLKDVADTRIGSEERRGISGGERKRTSIAVEMISRPSVIYMDEPTTGLDSFQALNVMTALNDLANEGRTIICTIHQPRSKIFDLFDRLLLLHAGRPVFHGSASDALPYFDSLGHPCPQHYNPADFIVDLVSVDTRNAKSLEQSQHRTRRLVEAFAEAAVLQEWEKGSDLALPTGQQDCAARCIKRFDSPFASTWLTQLFVLTNRSWLQTRRHWRLHCVGASQGLFLGVIGGVLFRNTQGSLGGVYGLVGLLFFVALFVAFETAFALINFYPPERMVVSRERAVNSYRASAYYLAKMSSLAPMQLIPVILFGLLIHYIDHLNSASGRTARFFFTISVSGLSFATLGLMISSMVSDVQLAAIVCTSVSVTLFLVGGFLVNISHIPWVFRWLTYISPFTWSFVGLVINQFEGTPSQCAEGSPSCPTGDQLIAALGFDEFTFWATILYQCLCQIGLHFMAYFAVLTNTPRFTRKLRP